MASAQEKLMLPQILPVLILLNNLSGSSPDYIMEKVERCYAIGQTAYRLLDMPNSAKLYAWLEKWHAKDIYTEAELQEILLQAAISL